MPGLMVGEVAKRAGVNLQTIHYYERRGLLAKPPRTASNYRTYPDDAVRRVRFIKRAQELGFTLNEIKELLGLCAEPDAQCGDVRQRATAKMKDIDERVRTLLAMRKVLSRLTTECSGAGPISACPILDALDADEEESCHASN